MYKVYTNSIEVIDVDSNSLCFYSTETSETVTIKISDLSVNNPKIISKINIDDQVLFEYKINNYSTIYLYTNDNTLYILKESIHSLDVIKTKSIYPVQIENLCSSLQVRQLAFCRLEVFLNPFKHIAFIDDFITNNTIDLTVPCVMDFDFGRTRFHLISKVKYDKYYLFFTYDAFLKELNIKKVFLKIIEQNKDINICLVSPDKLSIENTITEERKIIDYKNISNKKAKAVFDSSNVKQFKNDNMLKLFEIDGIRYYIYVKLNGIFLIKNNPTKATLYKSFLRSFSLGKNLFIFGRMVHHAYNSFGKYDYLYASDEKHQVSKFVRPFEKVKFLKQFGYFKVPYNKMDLEDRVHYSLMIGSKDKALHKFKIGKNVPPSKVYSVKRMEDKVLVLRSTIYKNATYSIVPYSEMYSFQSKVKIKAAFAISKLFFKNKKYNLNLFFEKQASKADESGFRVFEEVKQLPDLKSKNHFILDKNAAMYPEMKKKYGNDIIERFSFKHYLSIFNSDYFMSSDLSNHVINDRIYINEILSKIKSVPLIFLQHGIMFAKPVENPLGKIFYKDYSAYNVYKNVVNSKLEAEIFYKMGYTDEDLIYSGLATFDYGKLDTTSDKIVYMPTYRYWEEGMIYSGDIEKTTYFKSLIKVIKAFEKAGLRDKLMICSHNKFAEYISKSMEEYQDVLGPNPSEALKVGRIFISDFSSAIYDGIYRGAYPIFYWEDKEYLIEKYGAVPPVNEENAPGPIAYDTDSLVNIAKRAIQQSYVLEDDFKEKYLNINSFNDNKNTKRIVDFLINENIL